MSSRSHVSVSARSFKHQFRLPKYSSLLLAILAFFNAPLHASVPADFETQEYRNSTGLWLINASTAYARGYTGKGVTLAVPDSGVNQAHREFSNKNFTWIPCDGYIYDWKEYNHGSYVAELLPRMLILRLQRD